MDTSHLAQHNLSHGYRHVNILECYAIGQPQVGLLCSVCDVGYFYRPRLCHASAVIVRLFTAIVCKTNLADHLVRHLAAIIHFLFPR